MCRDNGLTMIFCPKRATKAFARQTPNIVKILRELCRRKDVEIIEAYAMPDHIHMLLSIPPNVSVSSFMGYLKGKSTMMIFERYAKLKYRYGNRHFWNRVYFVSTVGGNEQAIIQYIRNQEKEDMISNQIGLVEYYDPFRERVDSVTKKKINRLLVCGQRAKIVL